MRTIREIHDAFDRRELTPSQLTRDFLARARASRHNAYLTVAAERAAAQAARADDVLAREGRVPRERAPLLGIPLGIKDSLVTEGVRTTAASRMLEDYVPPYTATCVTRLEAAGAVMLGKLNQDEFAMGGSNENSAFGPVVHPTHPDRVPGGSSGGSAAAVRADLCWAALGSDTGGSVRLPAAYCGVVGFKPTYGRVSRFGLIAFASSLDQVGPIARSAEDAALITQVMGGHDPLDSTSLPRPAGDYVGALAGATWRGVRVGVPEEFFAGGGVQPPVERAVRAAMAWMEQQGATLVPVRLPHAKHAIAVYYVVAVSEAASNLSRYDGVRFGRRPPDADAAGELEDFYKRARAGFGPEVKRRILLGTFALSSGYYDAYYRRACQVRRLIQRDFTEAFAQVDVIAAPVAPTTAYRVGEKARDPLAMYLNDLFTVPANLAGLPALSVPCGQDADGLSVGLQLIGPQLGDERLLGLAHAFESGLRPGETGLRPGETGVRPANTGAPAPGGAGKA
jgi:aspartyl-tRNA(Asn)/glutamyl-tRNA(Gln) amidotransferase subunit A